MPINVGTGIDTTVAELAEILIDAVGVDVKPQFNPRPCSSRVAPPISRGPGRSSASKPTIPVARA